MYLKQGRGRTMKGSGKLCVVCWRRFFLWMLWTEYYLVQYCLYLVRGSQRGLRALFRLHCCHSFACECFHTAYFSCFIQRSCRVRLGTDTALAYFLHAWIPLLFIYFLHLFQNVFMPLKTTHNNAILYMQIRKKRIRL